MNPANHAFKKIEILVVAFTNLSKFLLLKMPIPTKKTTTPINPKFTSGSEIALNANPTPEAAYVGNKTRIICVSNSTGLPGHKTLGMGFAIKLM